MKARLIPLFFKSGMDDDYREQLVRLQNLFGQDAEFYEPVPLGSPLPDCDAVIFPQILGDAYRQISDLAKIRVPFLVVTSEFGTVNMWDWEIVSYLKAKGLTVFAPYTRDLTAKIIRSLALKRDLPGTKFLVFQDTPGEGMQGSIFKRFYWWEDECARRIQEAYGISIIKKSFKEFGAAAKIIPDSEAEKVWKQWNLPTEGITRDDLYKSVKIYIALKREIASDPLIRAAGINCLNESFYSDTTPCLAWNMLYEEMGLVWACEGDTVALLTMYLVAKTLHEPFMMSNIYPFLMGMAALKHEKINHFPAVDEPDNHLLVAHCGYLGVLPKCFSTQWTLRPPVLAIVDEHSTAIDARLPTGAVTLVKLDSTLAKLLVIEGELTSYAQYPGSDCRNGAVIKVRDGHRMMERVSSHHTIIVTGHRAPELRIVSSTLGLAIDEV
ncbi:MAG TPA: hypothetical protein VLH40_08820 [Atribacteraceae bacterium]|nr:hypothetical protein [Atribacteraceae bacterium]